jgi:DNA-binding XRE family transcriptional regulator
VNDKKVRHLIMSTNAKPAYSDSLRYHRQKHGWSQQRVAELVETSEDMVSRWERGICMPSPYYREKLCALFQTDAEALGFLAKVTTYPALQGAGIERQNMSSSRSMNTPVSTTMEIEGTIVVGHNYGEKIDTSSESTSLYTLASPGANWLMQLADVDCFAVDDLILLTNSDHFQGWGHHEIVATALSKPLPVPDDVEAARKERLPAIEKRFINSSHYRLSSYTPAFSDRKGLEVTLAPIGFHDYYTIATILDEPLLTGSDGSKISIRQKYGHTAFTYGSADQDNCLIPSPVSLQGVLITQDQQIVLMQRSSSVAFYPNHWSASFEETMNALGPDPKGILRPGDHDFFECAIRGLQEEFGITAEAIEDIKILSLDIEYLILAVAVVAVINVNLTAEAVKTSWLLKAADKNEASKFAVLSTDLPTVVDALFSKKLWHPTARMRLIQYLFHRYSVDEVAYAIQARKSR